MLRGVVLGPPVYDITLWVELFVIDSDIGGKPDTKMVIFREFSPTFIESHHQEETAVYKGVL